MTSFRVQLPPHIKEVITPEFYEDEDFQWKIVDNKMTRDYVGVLLISSVILIIVVLL